MKKTAFLVSTLVLAVLVACKETPKTEEGQSETPPPDFKIEFGQVSKKSIFRNDSLSIWGGSLVKGEDGLYHMFYARWPKKIGWEWVNYSEIAHAVSKSPFGPFEHRDVALPDRGPQFWDGSTTTTPPFINSMASIISTIWQYR